MKKVFLLLCFCYCFFTQNSNAQEYYDRRGQAIYLELIGSGVIYSVNYERRFKQQTDGLGARIGFGYLGEWTVVPVNVNILLGKEGKDQFLELGAGVTYINYPDGETFGNKTVNQQLMPAFTIMYRRHPRYGKFFFKIGLTPIYGYFDEEKAKRFFIPLFGVAFGRAF